MFFFYVCFFFFKQKTAYEMRISDWSSDVCSSDLASVDFREAALALASTWPFARRLVNSGRLSLPHVYRATPLTTPDVDRWNDEIGRASCRERVCQYV